MNITQEKIDDLNSIVKLTISEEDYKEKVNKVLKDYSKKAVIKGFRPGKVPMRMVEKMYGLNVKAEEVDKLVSEKLSNFIMESNLNVLGQPLPSKDQKPIDLEMAGEIEFIFDLATAPDFQIEISQDISVPYYKIKVEDSIIEKEIENHKSRYGKTENAEIASEDSYIKGDIEQLDENGNQFEDSIKSYNTYISVSLIQDSETKDRFIGANVNQILSFDIKKSFVNHTEISSMLKIDKSKVESLNPNFQITINSISNYLKAEVNQELFDKIYGEDNVKTEEEYRNRIKSEIEEIYETDSDFKFQQDAKRELLKIANLPLPDEFLKRWLKANDQEGKITEKSLSKEYPYFSDDLRWQLIRNSISEKQTFEITEQELLDSAVISTREQFRQYGLPISTISSEQLENIAKSQLERKEDLEKIRIRVLDDKVFTFIKGNVNLVETEVSQDELRELYKKEAGYEEQEAND